MRDVLHQHLTRVQLRMKHQADKHRTERQFGAGDWVYLKLQPYVQKSVATRANQKLSFRYYGPYQVVKPMGRAAYELDLPSTAKIHRVMHVSQLKKAIRATDKVSRELPVQQEDEVCLPERVLQNRDYIKHGFKGKQLLIKWTGMAEDLATWEDEHELKAKFPAAPAWGQAGVKEGGDVMILPDTTTMPSLTKETVNSHDGAHVKQAAEKQQARKSTRGPKPNLKYTGPDWTR